MITNLLVMNSSYTGSRDLWWVDDPEATKGYSIYRAFDHPSNWQRINPYPWVGHFYRDQSALENVLYTVQDADWLEQGNGLGRWGFRIPDFPYSDVVQGRPVLANNCDAVTVILDGQSFRPVKVSGLDKSIWLQMDNTVPIGGAVSAYPLKSNGTVWQADYSGVQKFQVQYKKLHNFVEIYESLVRTFYCYSDDTEVFTKDGWKLFQDCSKDEVFASRKIGTKEFEWQKATGHFRFRYDGNLTHFHGQSTDILVTPNHRMLVDSVPDGISGNPRPRKGGEQVVEAALLAKHHSTRTGIATTSVWKGEELTDVVLGGKRRSNRGTTPKKFVLSGDDFCRLMGMYLAEGSILHDNKGFTITQPKDERGARKLYEDFLVQVFGRKAVYADDKNLVVHSVGIAGYLRQFGHAHDKFIPNEIRESHPRQLEIFWDFYYMGDGSAAGDNGGSQVAFTVSKRLADQLTEIIQKMGASSTTCIKPAAEGEIQGRKISCRQGYFVTRHARKSGYTANWKTEEVEYHGDVFCVSVPNMFLYVRRNGKACWSGNTVVPIGENGELHKPGAKDTMIVNTMEVDKITWEYQEMVRRNQWIFEEVGEPAYLMFKKTRGKLCGCSDTGLGQARTACSSCFGVGIVGGYYGPYDFIYIDPDTALSVELNEGGRKVTRSSQSYLGPTPIIQAGDLIVRRNGERLVVGPVVYKQPRGILLQQEFSTTLLDEGDTRYLIPINTGLPTIYNPVVRPDPNEGEAGPFVGNKGPSGGPNPTGSGEPIFDPRTVPGKDWENLHIPIGRSVVFGKIQT